MEIIKGRDFFRIPEWLCIVLYTIAACALSFALFMYTMPKEKVIRYSQAKPSIFVIAHNVYQNLDGTNIYSLEYAVDGEVQIPANFTSEKRMIEFEGYLYQMGVREK